MIDLNEMQSESACSKQEEFKGDGKRGRPIQEVKRSPKHTRLCEPARTRLKALVRNGDDVCDFRVVDCLVFEAGLLALEQASEDELIALLAQAKKGN